MQHLQDKQYYINEKTFKNVMAFLVALYFLFTPLDYIAKIGDSNASYLRIIGIAIYAVGATWYFFSGKIPITKLHILMLYLMAFPYLASLWAVNFSTATNRAFSLVTTMLVVFVVIGFEFDEKHIRFMEYFAVIGAVVVGIILISDQGLSEFLQGGRIYLSGKESSDPNGMAGRLMMPLIFSAMLLVKEKKWLIKILFLFSFLLILLLFFMCGSRGGLVSLSVSFVFFIIIYLTSNKVKKIRGSVIILITLTLIIVMIFAEQILPAAIYERLFSADSYTGGNSRSSIWKVFFRDVYWQSPVIGFGTFGVYYKIGEAFGYDYYAIHNSYFCMLGEYGLFYLPVFMAMLVSVRKRISAPKQPIYIMLFYGICGVIFFLDAYESKYFWNMIMYILIVTDLQRRKDAAENAAHDEVKNRE